MKDSIVYLRKPYRTPIAIFRMAFVFAMLTYAPLRAQQVIAGPDGYSGCAIDASGNLYTWGIDQYFQTVVSTTAGHTQDLSPVQVGFPTGVTSWTSASVGYLFTLAIGNDGNAYAWGLNSNGQLGNGTTTNSSVPVMVALPSGVTAKAVAAGEGFSLALGSDGNVYAWGLNSLGQLGDSTTTNSNSPVMVKLPGGVSVKAIFAAPGFSLALSTDGSIYAWGGNSTGQLGDSTTTNSTIPVKVDLPTGVTAEAISAGSSFGLAIGSDGNLYSWGGNGFGQLGDGTKTNSSVPVKVHLPTGVGAKAVTGGRLFAAAIGSDGNIYTWGDNLYGELGNGTVDVPKSDSLPEAIPLRKGVTALGITAIRWSGFVLGSDDSVYAWGYNQEAELGLGYGTGGPKYAVGSPAIISGLVLGSPLSNNPAIPVLVSPSAGTTSIPRKATLVWNSSSQATSYHLQISPSPVFTTITFDTTMADTSVKLSAPLTAETWYYWHVSASDTSGSSGFSAVDSFETGTGIDGIDQQMNFPRQFALLQNYPNPFNPSTVIGYNVAAPSMVRISVYNVLGEKVAALVDGVMPPGQYTLTFDGSKLASGLYFYRMTAGHFVSVKKFLLMK